MWSKNIQQVITVKIASLKVLFMNLATTFKNRCYQLANLSIFNVLAKKVMEYFMIERRKMFNDIQAKHVAVLL